MTLSFVANKKRGFTIIELLIVIVVIGILAAITIVSYTGVQKGAIDKAVLSDADAVSGEVARYGTLRTGLYDSGIVWYSPSGTNANISFIPTKNDVIDVNVSTSEYCIRVFNTTSKTYKTLATAAKVGSTATSCTTISPSAAATAAN